MQSASPLHAPSRVGRLLWPSAGWSNCSFQSVPLLWLPLRWNGLSCQSKSAHQEIYSDLWTIFDSNGFFVYTENVLDHWVQLMKRGAKTKLFWLYIFISVGLLRKILTILRAQQKLVLPPKWSFQVRVIKYFFIFTKLLMVLNNRGIEG